MHREVLLSGQRPQRPSLGPSPPQAPGLGHISSHVWNLPRATVFQSGNYLRPQYHLQI